jgi:hypothetical protein
MKSSLMLLLISLVTTACTTHEMPYETYKDRIRPGMEREKAIEVLQESAWYYQECPRGDYVEDLFFFGSHRYDRAEILIVDSDLTVSPSTVRGIGTFEPYAWHTAYADCIEQERFEK